jgi:NAD(P)-dependent dehydrogenase (short-subunit alcohol dehydrogenase family)
VVVVTGAGNGLGRAYALYLAGQGAQVVVNDLGGTVHGEGADTTPALGVVAEIEAAGGMAVASPHDVSDWKQAEELIRLAVDTFGDVHVLVNNAGILRDRALVNVTEEEWDAVIRVHLKGHAAPTKFALRHWRSQSKQSGPVKASVIHTSSVSGLAGIFGQANYASAKMGIVGLSRITSIEGSAYGVRSNVISPAARTRISQSVGAVEQSVPTLSFDNHDPVNVAPLVSWLAEADCLADSQVFHLEGSRLVSIRTADVAWVLNHDGPWTPEELDRAVRPRLIRPPSIEAILGRNPIGSRD